MPRQTLLVLNGLMGVGKSALSRSLGNRLQWPVVDKDDFSDVLLDYLEPYGPASYACMFSAAESLLAQGFSVICDSPLRGEVGYTHAKTLATRVGAELRIVICALSDASIWQARLETRERRPAHILRTWADLTRYRQEADADFDYPLASPTLELDMAAPLETLTERVVTWLQPNSEVCH